MREECYTLGDKWYERRMLYLRSLMICWKYLISKMDTKENPEKRKFLKGKLRYEGSKPIVCYELYVV
ncbi:UNVERIFIED_CONTAM: hypothetical protein RMT77_007089 [Armadillidium vulgare]